MSNTAIPKNLLSFVWKYFSSHDSDTIVLRKSLIKICSGSHTSALLLSQLIYWHNKYHDMERWMKITYDEWYDQILLTKRQISYSREKLESIGLIETKLKKFNNAPSLHYRVNFEKLYKILIELDNDCRKSQNVTMESNKMSLSHSDKMSQPITEITTENTSDTTTSNVVVVKDLLEEEQAKLKQAYSDNPFTTDNIQSEVDFLFAALYSLMNRDENISRKQRLHGIIKLVKMRSFEEPVGWVKQKNAKRFDNESEQERKNRQYVEYEFWKEKNQAGYVSEFLENHGRDKFIEKGYNVR